MVKQIKPFLYIQTGFLPLDLSNASRIMWQVYDHVRSREFVSWSPSSAAVLFGWSGVKKMSYKGGIGAKQALKEHVLAVSRDFISQPRLSKYYQCNILPILMLF